MTNFNAYSVKYSGFKKQYIVVNVITGLAHSAWKNRSDASKVMRDLNRQ